MLSIKYIGHSCFYLSDGRTALVIDPFGDIGYPFPRLKADYVAVSHGHYDHNAVQNVGGNPAVVNGGFSGAFSAESITVNHDGEGGKLRGKTLIYKIRMGGYTICHMGDAGEQPCARILDFLSDADVVLMPVGGKYTIDAATAAKYAVKLTAAVIPMHYKDRDCTVDVEDLSAFTERFKDEDIDCVGRDTLELNGQKIKKITVLKRGV